MDFRLFSCLPLTDDRSWLWVTSSDLSGCITVKWPQKTSIQSSQMTSVSSVWKNFKCSIRIWCSKERSPTLSKGIISLISSSVLPRPDSCQDQSSYTCSNPSKPIWTLSEPSKPFQTFQSCPKLPTKAVRTSLRRKKIFMDWKLIRLSIRITKMVSSSLATYPSSIFDNSCQVFLIQFWAIFKTSWIEFNSTFHTAVFASENRDFWQSSHFWTKIATMISVSLTVEKNK